MFNKKLLAIIACLGLIGEVEAKNKKGSHNKHVTTSHPNKVKPTKHSSGPTKHNSKPAKKTGGFLSLSNLGHLASRAGHAAASAGKRAANYISHNAAAKAELEKVGSAALVAGVTGGNIKNAIKNQATEDAKQAIGISPAPAPATEENTPSDAPTFDTSMTGYDADGNELAYNEDNTDFEGSDADGNSITAADGDPIFDAAADPKNAFTIGTDESGALTFEYDASQSTSEESNGDGTGENNGDGTGENNVDSEETQSNDGTSSFGD